MASYERKDRRRTLRRRPPVSSPIRKKPRTPDYTSSRQPFQGAPTVGHGPISAPKAPKGAKVNSPGRKPWGQGRHHTIAPTGRQWRRVQSRSRRNLPGCHLNTCTPITMCARISSIEWECWWAATRPVRILGLVNKHLVMRLK